MPYFSCMINDLILFRFCLIFDDVISTYFNLFAKKKEKSSMKVLTRITSKCLSAVKHQLVESVDLPLILSLNHPKRAIRCAAVQQLSVSFHSGGHEYDSEFFKQAIIARLNDDSALVVEETIKCSNMVLSVLSIDELLENLMKLMERSDFQFNLNNLIIGVVTNIHNASSRYVDEFVYALFGQLFYIFAGKKNKKMVEALESADIKTDNVFLRGIKQSLCNLPKSKSKTGCNVDVAVQAYECLLKCVADELMIVDNGIQFLKKFWLFQLELPDSHILRFVAIILINHLVVEQPSEFLYEVTNLLFQKYFELSAQCNTESILNRYADGRDLQSMCNMLFKSISEEDNKEKGRIECAFVAFLQNILENFSNDLGMFFLVF